MKQPIQEKFRDRIILLFVAGVFMLCSPLRFFWGADGNPWYIPYLIWLILIALTWALYRWLKQHEF